MSLFQSREWWRIQNGIDEEFDTGCLAIGTFQQDSTIEHLVTGSHAGILRIYLPGQKGYRIDDLIIEEQLEYPILQIEIGYFITNCMEKAIAILHPRHVVLYLVDSIGGVGNAASYVKLVKKLEYELGRDGEHFTAYNMTMGAFGHSFGRDHLCIQSMDGRLQFFEQDSFAFTQQFLKCLVPGPLLYVSQMDSILTATSDMYIECYKYQVLATSRVSDAASLKGALKGESKYDAGNDSIHKAGKLRADWRTNIGEHIVAIQTGRLSLSLTPAQFDIIVLGEFSLFCLKAQGSIRLQKRLGYSPSSLCVYDRPGDSDPAHNIIVGTHCKHWMVYRDTQLIWSACSSSIPVSMSVVQFGTIPAMIVCLDAAGLLNVNYLGTDPLSTVVGTSESRELDFDEMDAERMQLLAVIRQTQGENRVEPRERVLLRIQVPDILDPVADNPEDFRTGHNYAKTDNGGIVQLTVRIFITYTGTSAIRDVTLGINPPSGIAASQTSVLLPVINGGATSTPLIVQIQLMPTGQFMPTVMEFSVSAAYTLDSGRPRNSICVVKLPLLLFCKLVPPIKSSPVKVILITNQPPPTLTDLFADLLSQPGSTQDWVKMVTSGSSNALSFQYFNGIAVTIVVSKNSGKYRIQSTDIEALWFISNEFMNRLHLFFDQNPTEEPLSVSYDAPLPLTELFESIDHHFEIRKAISALNGDMNKRAHQYRMVQKRLLVRFKDRSPIPLNFLDALLQGSYTQILDLANHMTRAQADLQVASNRLSCMTHFMLLLLRLRFDLSSEDMDVLSAHLSPHIVDSPDQGWEELTDVAMMHLLRTTLSKTEGPSSIRSDTIIMATDTQTLKKHFTIVCDRLAKGAKLTKEVIKKIVPIAEKEEYQAEEKEEYQAEEKEEYQAEEKGEYNAEEKEEYQVEENEHK